MRLALQKGGGSVDDETTNYRNDHLSCNGWTLRCRACVAELLGRSLVLVGSVELPESRNYLILETGFRRDVEPESVTRAVENAVESVWMIDVATD